MSARTLDINIIEELLNIFCDNLVSGGITILDLTILPHIFLFGILADWRYARIGRIFHQDSRYYRVD